jgi:hypothetical protein
LKNSIVLAPLLLSLHLAIACTVTQGQPSPAGSDAGAPDGMVATNAGTTSCSEAVTCISNCADGDDACSNACYDRASPGGQSLLTALVSCINDNTCADSACVNQKCPSELSGCLDDVAPVVDSGIPPTTAAPLPAALVGRWSSVNLSTGESFDFNADGTYSSLLIYEPSGRCVATSRLAAYIEGVASTNGQSLSITPTKGRVETTDCSDTTTTKPSSPPNRAFTWSVDGNLLTLTENGTSTKYKRG